MGLVRILSIDGGGVRGIIPSQVLITLEHILQKLSGRKDARIGDYFDLIAGTSAGGILTAMYLCPDKNNTKKPRFSAEEIGRIFINECKSTFTKSIFHRVTTGFGLFGTIYSSKNIDDNFEKYLGDIKLSELLKPCLIPAYDIENHSAIFFNQMSAIKSKSKDFFVKDVVRATSSVPIYFPVAKIKSLTEKSYTLIDGGVFAGNPAMCAYAEVSKFRNNPVAKDIMMLSIGTGSDERGYAYDKVKQWGLVQWTIPTLNILMWSSVETVDYQLRMMFDSINKSTNYFRIQTDLKNKIRLDDCSDRNIKLLNEIGEDLSNKYFTKLYDFGKQLLLQ